MSELIESGELLYVDYCKPIRGGLLIYLSGQFLNGKPVGEWKEIDENGNIKNIFDGKDFPNYETA